MKTLEELKLKSKLILDRQGGILAAADLEGRDLTDEEAKLYGALEMQYNNLRHDIEQLEPKEPEHRLPNWSPHAERLAGPIGMLEEIKKALDEVNKNIKELISTVALAGWMQSRAAECPRKGTEDA